MLCAYISKHFALPSRNWFERCVYLESKNTSRKLITIYDFIFNLCIVIILRKTISESKYKFIDVMLGIVLLSAENKTGNTIAAIQTYE